MPRLEPLLTDGPGSTESTGIGPHFQSLTRLWESTIAAIDFIVFLPLYPAIFAKQYVERRGDTSLEALWALLTIVATSTALIFGVFVPFLLVWTICFLSYWVLCIADFLYEFRSTRVAVRVAAVAAILFSLWHWVHLRREPCFASSDFPPLSNFNTSIRLLDVQPAGERWPIETHLRTVQLEDRPLYESLSYAWGSNKTTHSISVGGKRFPVTESLWKALHNIRDATEPKTLWVDAICIDQRSDDEKSRQVPVMHLIYQQATRVLVSLGTHTPPRWVQRSDPSRWTSVSVIEGAASYWEATHYWLTRIMSEEYWKRCWVVQEIGSGASIDVYAGRQPIPWDRFVQLTKVFELRDAESKLPRRVLRFDELRKSRRQSCEGSGPTYVLSRLLDIFKDSFCSETKDKLLGFVAMAVDCRGERLTVEKGAGERHIYEAAISFQNSTKTQPEDLESSIEMFYFAALVRRLLFRQHKHVMDTFVKPGWYYQPESWTYYWCGDDAPSLQFCVTGYQHLLLLVMDFLRAPYAALKPIKKYPSLVWKPDDAEIKENWVSDSEGGLVGIRTIGAVVGEVQELGPTYSEYLDNPSIWDERLKTRYSSEWATKRAEGLNGRLSALLGSAHDFRLNDIVALPSRNESERLSNRQRLFFGGGDVIMGLAPSNTQVGDKLCQFWNSSAIAILRSQGDNRGSGLEVIGRGAMLQHGNETDWDVPLSKTRFLPSSPGSLELTLDLKTLNDLSWDIVNLPGS
ncbi:heterokaryon incompatibility protein-domain-containing protein [Lasiosphaeria hispida]|uniref:Heterokaryon incompatibility protein-domain-containing protein n=1 Tax=Lasiosphaeria hispida TaxID=260671 RepID=A0AAJ0MAN6_9PEZI|nr:heterokaryon incompatibility protein-domain-containing protein [Lasiosphaeria hispida]